jgi:deoxyadenosine/deoxycytidine kinase
MNQSEPKSPGYIVVEGPIGAGKTTLVKRLAESFQCDLMLEAPEENPFLERFYREGKQAALPTQLFFLFQRAQQLQGLRQNDLFRSQALVSDFMLDKDRLFAQATLDKDELELYDKVFEKMSLEAPRPDLVVYLQAPADVLMQRVRRRSNPIEQGIEQEYLKRLCDAYTEFFFHYDASPLLIVNASQLNPVDREEDYQLLLQQIQGIHSGRHYFNPEPALL